MIALPDKASNEGAEARVLIAECPGPGANSYTLSLASEAMQLMDAVLRNRLANPGPFGAKGATTIAGVIKAKGQFYGFEGYPNYNSGIKQNIQSSIDIANNPKDKRSAAYTSFLEKAIEIAKLTKFSDPSPGKLVAWRTAHSGSAGKNFIEYKTVFGNTFFYQIIPKN